jgi:hypothetical protein
MNQRQLHITDYLREEQDILKRHSIEPVPERSRNTTWKKFLELILAADFLVFTQTGCVVVGGYSSRGGWFFWPGGLAIAVLLLLFLFFLRRGR